MTDVQQPGYGRPDFRRSDVGAPRQRVQLTTEEMKDLSDCLKNSSVLLPVIGGAILGYYSHKVTRLHAYAKYAAVSGGLIGLILGRLGISHACLMKVSSMPQHSTLRDRLMRGDKYISERQIFQSPDAAKSSEELSTIVFDDYPPMNSYDTYSSLNDSSDISVSEDTDLSEPIHFQKGITYDELRYENREEYYKKNKQYYVPQTSERYPNTETTGEQQQQQQRQRQTPASSTPMQEKTKYGDMWG